jgi:DNA-binding response OmpR family regulator
LLFVGLAVCCQEGRFNQSAEEETAVHVMVVAADQDEKDFLVFMLRKAGHAVASSSELARVLASWTDHPADLIVLALEEGQDALAALQTVRATTEAPLLMVVEGQAERTICRLLEEGADIVLQRPLSVHILTAHVQALSRRVGALPGFVLPNLNLEEIILDPSSRTVTVAGEEPKRLTQLEFRLLYVLMTNRGQVVPVETIVERVWGYTGEGNRDLVRGLVSRLRHKIEQHSETPRFLETIPSVGYRFLVGNE